jgi:hypothetical protein
MVEQPDNFYTERLNFMYEVMASKQKWLDESFNILVGKINFLFAFTGAFTGFYATLLYQEELLETNVRLLLFGRMAALAGLLGAMICLLLAAQTRAFANAPHEDTIYGHEASALATDTLKNKVIADMKFGYQANVKIMSKISGLLKVANWLILLSISVIVVTLIV